MGWSKSRPTATFSSTLLMNAMLESGLYNFSRSLSTVELLEMVLQLRFLACSEIVLAGSCYLLWQQDTCSVFFRRSVMQETRLRVLEEQSLVVLCSSLVVGSSRMNWYVTGCMHSSSIYSQYSSSVVSFL